MFRERMLRVLYALQYRTGFGLTSFRWPGRSPVLERIYGIWQRRRMELAPLAAFQLYVGAQSTAKLPGDMAEVGVFRGASAKLIRDAVPPKALHLFDTFEGLPEPDRQVDPKFHKGQFASTLDEVQHYLSGVSNLHFYKGPFPATAAAIADHSFSFVHLDVDLYQSTRDALEFFYPRMVQGGVILTHDYASAEGPTRAFTEFFADRPEPVIELGANQCLIVKTS